MAKFDRSKDGVKARVDFIRGSVRKKKGQELTDEELATMTDEAVDNEVLFNRLEILTDAKAEGDAGSPASDTSGSASASEAPAGRTARKAS